MGLLRGLLKWLLRLVLALVVGVALYVAYARWAWRDIPLSVMEQKYGAGTQTAVVDGVPVRYQRAGSGPALVLIHSHYMDMAMWDAWLPLLTQHFTVLRYDLTSHGLTGPDPTGEYTVQRDVTLLDGLLQQLQIGDVALVGSSLGGNIAFTFAAQQPQRVRALVLINSGGLKRSDKPGRSGKNIPAWANHVLPLVPPAALHKFLKWMIVDDALVTEAMQTRFVDDWRREGNRVAELARLRQFETGEPEPLLARITAPTLVL
jgi:pimeloyl-ACP methyl ester carboxylesterase